MNKPIFGYMGNMIAGTLAESIFVEWMLTLEGQRVAAEHGAKRANEMTALRAAAIFQMGVYGTHKRNHEAARQLVKASGVEVR